MAEPWTPPEWLVSAMVDAFLGGEFPCYMDSEAVVESGVLQAMHDMGVRFDMAVSGRNVDR